MSKLELWQERLEQSKQAYDSEHVLMDHREDLYAGDRRLKPMSAEDRFLTETDTPHRRNIVFENIESMVSTAIPMPKVTARHKEDEPRAELIEHMIRNELDRLPIEEINDLAERIVPMQGGCAYLVEWDSTAHSPDHDGEVLLTLLHPRQLAPQPGVYNVQDMDWIIVRMPTTKDEVRKRYGKSVENETDAEPELRSQDQVYAPDAVTVYIGFERSDRGTVNKYVWCNDVELEDIESYQSRHLPVCRNCGHAKPYLGETVTPFAKRKAEQEQIVSEIAAAALGESIAQGEDVTYTDTAPEEYRGGACPYCGADDWTEREQEYQPIAVPIVTATMTIPGATPTFEGAVPVMHNTMIPYYKPDEFPIIIQKSVSVWGKLFGNSDVDIIEDQQNTINRMEKKIIDRITKAGTRITLPPKTKFQCDPNDQEKIYLESPDLVNYVHTVDFTGNLQYEMAYLAQAYEEARQELGITDSFQGRADTTAKSGIAKQFAAAQSAGRLESRRVMKSYAFSKLFEMIFKFRLAYQDEPLPVSWTDSNGARVYDTFSRYDFLKTDENGDYYWNDQFLFSVDPSDTLANNREQMWQLNRELLATGAFGDPTAQETLILFWTKMEALHFPTAAETKKHLEEQLKQRQMQMQQMQMQQAQPMPGQSAGQPMQIPPQNGVM